MEAELELIRKKAIALQEEVNDLAFRLGQEIARRKALEAELICIREQRDALLKAVE